MQLPYNTPQVSLAVSLMNAVDCACAGGSGAVLIHALRSALVAARGADYLGLSRRQRNALIVAGLLRKIRLIAGRQRLSALPLLSPVPERRSQRRMSAAMIALFPKWMDTARVLQSPYDQGSRLTQHVAGWSDLVAWSDWFEDIVHPLQTVSFANLRSSTCLQISPLADCGRQLLEWLIQDPHVQRGFADAAFSHRYLIQIHGESWQQNDLAAVTDLWLRVVSITARSQSITP